MVSWAITGASRGLGLEFVQQISSNQSDTVFAIVRDPKEAKALNELAGSRSNVHVIKGDLVSLSELQEAAESIGKITGGSLDVLINNAAYLDTQATNIPPSQLTTPENLDIFKHALNSSIVVNAFGAVYVTNAFLPLIERGTEKKIVHTTTGLADTDLTLGVGIPALVPYSASKAVVNSIVARYGIELRPKDIHVVAISPGWVNTSPLPEEAEAFMTAAFRKVEPTASRITPEESVRDQLKTIRNLKWEVQGRAISQHGDSNWF